MTQGNRDSSRGLGVYGGSGEEIVIDKIKTQTERADRDTHSRQQTTDREASSSKKATTI